jgi:hypothetical protein
MYGPFFGTVHDAKMLKDSGLLDDLKAIGDVRAASGVQLALYGDSAYPLSKYLLRPFKGANLTADRRRVNYHFSTGRICVEWGLGLMTSLWQALSFDRYQKIAETSVARTYIVATFLTNLYVCMYGRDVSSTCQRFDLDPVSIEEYMDEVND